MSIQPIIFVILSLLLSTAAYAASRPFSQAPRESHEARPAAKAPEDSERRSA